MHILRATFDDDGNENNDDDDDDCECEDDDDEDEDHNEDIERRQPQGAAAQHMCATHLGSLEHDRILSPLALSAHCVTQCVALTFYMCKKSRWSP